MTARESREGRDADAHAVQVLVEDDRTGMDPVTLERAVLDHLIYSCSKDLSNATHRDLYEAMAHTVRDRLVHRWIKTQRAYYLADAKRVYYLSAEFLLGRLLGMNLVNLGLFATAQRLLRERYGIELSDVLEEEHDPGLGNGGLCLLYTSPSPRDRTRSRMPSSA